MDGIGVAMTSEINNIGVGAFEKAVIGLYTRSKHYMKLGGV